MRKKGKDTLRTLRFVDRDIFGLHAELCKTFASPKRLMIIALLGVRELSVGEMAEAMDVPMANVSQHLAILKARNVVRARKDRQTAYYSLVDRRLIKACDLIRTILLDDLKSRGLVAEGLDAKRVVVEE